MQRVGKCVVLVCTRGQTGESMNFMIDNDSEKVKKTFWFGDSFSLQKLKVMQIPKLGMLKGYHFSIERYSTRGVHFLSKKLSYHQLIFCLIVPIVSKERS